MKLYIEIPGAESKEQVKHLKKYLENERIDQIKKVKFKQKKSRNGEMGGGTIGTLTAVLVGVARPFSQLAQSFTKYAASYRTEIILKNEYGDEIILNTKKLDKEGIYLLVERFLDKKKKKSSGKSKD